MKIDFFNLLHIAIRYMYTEISKEHVISQNSQCMHSFHIFSERIYLLQEFLSGPNQDVKFQQSIINGLIGTHRDGNARRGRMPRIADPMR